MSRSSASALLLSHHSPSPASPASRTLDTLVSSFYDNASTLHHSLDALKTDFDALRALSARLHVLHPNSLETPTLALDLRDALLAAAQALRETDEGLFRLWGGEERVRRETLAGRYRLPKDQTLSTGSQADELDERRDEVDGLVRRLKRRIKEVRREARGERRDRKVAEDGRDEPEALGDYLEEGAYEFPHLLTKDTVHASRWVVSNPFSILLRLTDDLRTLKIPQVVKTNSTPSTFRPPTSPPLYSASPSTSLSPGPSPLIPSNPTPLGSSPSKPIPNWKAAILRDAAQRERAQHNGGRKTSRKVYDEVAQDLAEGYREIKVATERGHRERWIIFLTLALLPCLLIATLLEAWLASARTSSASTGSADAEGGSSADSAPTSTSERVSLRTLAPTLVASESTTMASRISDPDPFSDTRGVGNAAAYDSDIRAASPGQSASAPQMSQHPFARPATVASSAAMGAGAGAGTATSTSAAGAARTAPFLSASRTSGRGTSGKSTRTPWYLTWAGIATLIAALLIILGLGVGLGVGLGTKDDDSSAKAAQDNAAATATSYTTFSQIITANASTTALVSTVSGAAGSVVTQVSTVGGGTTIVPVDDNSQSVSRATITVSEAADPTTRIETVYVTTYASTQVVTTTLAGGAESTIFETVTVRRTVTGGGGARMAKRTAAPEPVPAPAGVTWKRAR
ncbi:hypothetical protein JCM10207_005168 [Rhodosporidiobolus poonsookiae]